MQTQVNALIHQVNQFSPKEYISPRHIHAIWKLLKHTSYFPIKKLDNIAKEVFTFANATDIKKLLFQSEQLKFVKKTDDGWQTELQGKDFASLEHWRYWEVSLELEDIVNQLNIKHYFLSHIFLTERPIIIDLFSGVGGLGLGFASTGYDVKVAVDNDPQACEAHRINFPDCEVLEKEIEEVVRNPRKILCEELNIRPDQIAGVIGGPPCQGFSYIGERVTNDERNLYTSHFIDVVLDIEPSFFVMENVIGLRTSGKKPDFYTMLKRLANPIGEPANQLVNELPNVPLSVAKRARQFRRRLVSQEITNFKQTVKDELVNYKFYEEVFCIIDNYHKILMDNFIKMLKNNYKNELFEKALKSLNQVEKQVAIVSIAATFEAFVECKLIKKSDSESIMKQYIKFEKESSFIRKVATEIIEEYDAAPESSVYEGKEIGPVLSNLIKKASEKYEVAVPTILNSAWYGCPQNRQRLFLVGIHKRHQKKICFPIATFSLPGEYSSQNELSLPTTPTTFDAIGDIPNVDDYEFLVEQDTLPVSKLTPYVSPYAAFLRLEVLSPGDKTIPRPSWNPFVLDCCKRTIHPNFVIERLSKTPEGKQEGTSGRTRLHRLKVSHTLRAGTREGKGSHTACRPIHYEHNRVITVREGARLMGYPDWMTFHATKWHGFRLVGNGVPAELATVIAKKIKEILYE